MVISILLFTPSDPKDDPVVPSYLLEIKMSGIFYYRQRRVSGTLQILPQKWRYKWLNLYYWCKAFERWSSRKTGPYTHWYISKWNPILQVRYNWIRSWSYQLHGKVINELLKFAIPAVLPAINTVLRYDHFTFTQIWKINRL